MMKERIPIGLKGLLAAGLYIFLALTMAALTMAPAAAAETVDVTPWLTEANMDPEGATPEQREAILRARAQIVYSKSWTVNGTMSVVHKDGTEEKLPEFSELFPGWNLSDISKFRADHPNSDPDFSNLWAKDYPEAIFNEGVLLKPEDGIWIESISGVVGTGDTVYAWAATLEPQVGEFCNIGFFDLTQNTDVGWMVNLQKGEQVYINTIDYDVYQVRVSAAAGSSEGYANIVVADNPASVTGSTAPAMKTSSWAKETVDRAIEMGLADEYLPGSSKDFTAPITRDHFCTLALNYVGLSNNFNYRFHDLIYANKDSIHPNGQSNNPFTDKPELDSGDVTTCYYLGIVGGYPDGSFGYGKTITRQEAAAVLFRAYAACGGELPAEAAELTFSDKDTIQDWAKDNVAALLEWNVMNGKENGNFDPRGLCTYEEAVAMFLRLYDNAPVSRVQGNVELIFPYDECMEYLQNTEVSYYRVVDTVEGPVATYVRCNTSGMMHSSSSLLLVYRNGGIQQIDTGIRVGMSGIPSGAKVENAQFSEDGKTFSCDVGIEDSYPDMSGQVSVVYHVTVNVDTLETVVTQSSTTPV